MTLVKRFGIGLAVLLVLAFITLATWEPFMASPASAASGKAYRAEIIRDEYGVPHIYGKTDADVAFGVAVAHAEDDFFTLQDVVAMSRGRYGAIAGEEGAVFDYAYHLLDARGTAQREYPKLPADTRALFEAYAAGLNHYADQHGEIGIDQRGVIGAEAEVDHPADRRRKNKRYDGGREQGCDCRCNHGLVPEEIRQQPGKRAKRSAGLSGWGLGFVGRGVGHWGLLVVPSRLSMFRSADNDFGQSCQEL